VLIERLLITRSFKMKLRLNQSNVKLQMPEYAQRRQNFNLLLVKPKSLGDWQNKRKLNKNYTKQRRFAIF
jgi:hypothetical protein